MMPVGVASVVFRDVFVFFNRGLDKVKILRYNRHGFWLCYRTPSGLLLTATGSPRTTLSWPMPQS